MDWNMLCSPLLSRGLGFENYQDLIKLSWQMVMAVRGWRKSFMKTCYWLLGLVRDGRSVRFWHYMWCGNTMFLIATDKKKCVYILFMDWSENGRSRLWNPTFIHAFQDWELGSSVLPFQPRICLRGCGNGRLHWKLKRACKFDV